MDFLNSMFAYYRSNLDEAQRRANQQQESGTLKSV